MAAAQAGVRYSSAQWTLTQPSSVTAVVQSAGYSQTSNPRGSSGPLSRAAAKLSRLKLDNSSGGRPGTGSLRTTPTTASAVSRSRPGQGLISILTPMSSSARSANAAASVGTPAPRQVGANHAPASSLAMAA